MARLAPLVHAQGVSLRRLAVLIVLSAALVAPPSASAITNGTADGERHPNVGGLVNATQYADGT